MKPKLDLTTDVAQRLAHLAIFERIQSTFNIYPTGMVIEFKEKAVLLKCSPIELVKPTFNCLQDCLSEAFDKAILLLKGESLQKDASFGQEKDRALKEYFKLNPAEIADGIRKKAQREGYDPIAAAEYLKKTSIEKVLPWAFEEVRRVLTPRH